MDPVDRVSNRVSDALFSGVFTIVMAATASWTMDAHSLSGNAIHVETYILLRSFTLLPLVMTLVGWAVAVYRAGPFGFVGYLFEFVGVSSLFNNPGDADFWIIVLGAVLVVAGAFVWSWKPVVEYVLESRSRRGPPPGGFR